MPARLLSSTTFVVAAFALVAVAGYGFSLGSFFLSDDFVFLSSVTTGDRWWWPQAIPGQIVRPLTMLSYRIDHALWQLEPFGYHLSSLILHALNGGLVFAISRRLSGSAAVGFWAGVWFLAFAGHAEPVSWMSGRADLLMAFCAMLSIWCYGGVIDQRSPRLARLAGSYAAFAAALVSKESAVTLPAVIAGLELSAWVDRRGTGGGEPAGVARAAFRMAGFAAVLLGYFALRYALLGVFGGDYGGYDVSQSINHLRLFIFRSMVPPSPFSATDLSSGIDVVLYAGLAATVTVIAWRRRSVSPLLPGAAIVVTLAPVLPLMLSISEPQGERFVYLPSAFGAMWWAMALAWPGPAAVWRQALIAALCGLNLVGLLQMNRRYVEAGSLAAGVISGFGRLTATAEQRPSQVFVLSAPDSYRGVYVFRSGLHQALRLFQPAAFEGAPLHIAGVVGHSTSRVDHHTSVTRLTPTAFRVDLGDGRIPYPPILSTEAYDVTDQDAGRFTITFRNSVDALVVFASDGTMQSAGIVQVP